MMTALSHLIRIVDEALRGVGVELQRRYTKVRKVPRTVARVDPQQRPYLKIPSQILSQGRNAPGPGINNIYSNNNT